MKKVFSLMLSLLFVAGAFAQSGKVTVSFVGFKCYKATWDDILNLDGKGDEVFFKFNLGMADRNGNSRFNYTKQTDVYGDATVKFANRISAGSCTDVFGGAKGGLRDGDSYNTNILLGEYDMNDGDILSIIPTAWEQDPIADNSNAFWGTVASVYQTVNQKLAPIMMTFHAMTGDLAAYIFQGLSLGISKTRPTGDQGELGKAGTRPIGMEKYGDFTPKVVAINTSNFNTLINSDFGFGKGVIAVDYDEEALGNFRDHGHYIILVKIAFVPKSTGIVPPPSNNNGSNSGYVPPPSNTNGNSNGNIVPPPANTNSGTATTGTAVNTNANTNTTTGIKQPITFTSPGATKIGTQTIKTNTTIAGGSTVAVINTLNESVLKGEWSGTRNKVEVTYKFDNGVFTLMRKNNKNADVEAKGTYQVSNNIVTITYTNGAGHNFKMVSTAYSGATQELSGTWQSADTNSADKGTWMVKKN